MFTIYITLKSFESYYIEKNTVFLKTLLLFTKNTTVNIKEIDVKEILGFQKQEKRKLKIGEKLKIQVCGNNKNEIFIKPDSFLKKMSPSESFSASIQAKATKNEENFEDFSCEKSRKLRVNQKISSTACNGEIIEIPSCSMLKKKFFNEINLPVKQKLFTVLRSVHVHKKSRLQFHLTYYIKKLTFKAANAKMMFLILYLVKNAEFYGVELEISFNHKTV